MALAVGTALPPTARAGVGQPEAAPETTDATAPANAQSPDADADRARQLAQEGRSLFWDGDYEAAIEAFSAAHALVADPNLLYNISAAYEKLGDFDRALDYLDRYQPDAPEDEHDAIAARRRELERAKTTAETQRDPEPPPTEDPVPGPAAPAPDEGERAPRLMGALGWSLVGVAGAGLAVGAGFGIAALGQSNRGRAQCFDDAGTLRCPTSAQAPLDAARRNAIIADVGFGVAVLATAAALTVLGVRLKARKRAQRGKADVSWRGLGASVAF